MVEKEEKQEVKIARERRDNMQQTPQNTAVLQYEP